jgi:hypothetical protein
MEDINDERSLWELEVTRSKRTLRTSGEAGQYHGHDSNRYKDAPNFSTSPKEKFPLLTERLSNSRWHPCYAYELFYIRKADKLLCCNSSTRAYHRAKSILAAHPFWSLPWWLSSPVNYTPAATWRCDQKAIQLGNSHSNVAACRFLQNGLVEPGGRSYSSSPIIFLKVWGR